MSAAPIRRPVSNLGDFIKDMVKSLPDCTQPEMRMALRESAVEFCRDTGAFCGRLDPIDVVANQLLYPMEVPYEAYIHTIKRVQMKAYAADTRPRDLVPTEYDTEDGEPMSLFLTYEPVADIAGGIIVTATFVPYPDAEDFPAEFLNRWGPAIVCGALALKQGERGRAWSDPVKYQENYARCRAGKSEAVIRRLNGGIAGSVDSKNPIPWL